jgi:hypothetical protein
VLHRVRRFWRESSVEADLKALLGGFDPDRCDAAVDVLRQQVDAYLLKGVAIREAVDRQEFRRARELHAAIARELPSVAVVPSPPPQSSLVRAMRGTNPEKLADEIRGRYQRAMHCRFRLSEIERHASDVLALHASYIESGRAIARQQILARAEANKGRRAVDRDGVVVTPWDFRRGVADDAYRPAWDDVAGDCSGGQSDPGMTDPGFADSTD